MKSKNKAIKYSILFIIITFTGYTLNEEIFEPYLDVNLFTLLFSGFLGLYFIERYEKVTA